VVLTSVSETQIHPPEGLTTEGLLGRRYLARLIDSVISGFALALVLTVLQRLPIQPGPLRLLIFLTVIVALAVGYYSIFESSGWQATPGKSLRGSRCTTIQAGD
jgi:uncharacterized RDD family membrane protein YckC